MKKSIGCLAALLAVAAAGDEIFVGYRGVTNINVATGETMVQSDAVAHASQGVINKVGGGMLVINGNAVVQNNDFTINVKEGTVEIASGGDVPARPVPTAILNSAAFWVDANSVTTDPDDATRVSAWHDVRETKTEEPFDYVWCKPKWEAGRPLDGVLPLLCEDAAGLKSIYFGGWDSGQSMKWCFNGNETNYSLKDIRHLFLVTTMTNSMGQTIGATKGGTPDFHRSGSAPGGSGYFSLFSGDDKAVHEGGVLFVDGKYTNITGEKIKKGRQLMEVRLCERSAEAGYFFCDREIAGRTGGDDLHEILVFTNFLSDAECKKVEDYLLDKWQLREQPEIDSITAPGGTIKMTVSAGETKDIKLVGEGTFVKDGEGTALVKALAGQPYRGDMDLQNGTLVVRNGGAWKLNKGDRLTVTELQEGITATKITDAGNDIVISGNVTVKEIPEDVQKLRVTAGSRLRLAQSPDIQAQQAADEAEKDVEVSITNAGFENHPTMTGNSRFTKGVLTYGWTARDNDIEWTITPNRDVYFFDKSNAPGTSNWGWTCNYLAPEGDVVLAIKGACTVSTGVTIPESGRYALSFYASGRYAASSQLDFTIKLVNKATNAETIFGRVKPYDTPYKKYTFASDVAEAGEYDLVLKPDDIARDGCATFDDFKLVKKSAKSIGIIPNGDFEITPPAGLTATQSYQINSVWPGWEFEPKEIPAESRSQYEGTSVGVVPIGFSGDASQIKTCTERDFDGNWVLAMVREGNVAKNTFVVPKAGLYSLKMKARSFMGYYSYWIETLSDTSMRSWSNVKATLEINGTIHDLGTLSITTFRAQEYVFANDIEIQSDAQQVTLRLHSMNERSMSLIDDVDLVPSVNDMIKNGSFESAGSGWANYWDLKANNDQCLNPEAAAGTVNGIRVMDLKSNRDFIERYFSTDNYDGNIILDVRNCASIEQNVRFYNPGLYELRFAAHSRTSDWTRYGRNPLQAWLQKDGVKRVIYQTPVDVTNFVEHACVFRISEAGEYKFAIQGMNTLTPELNDRDRAAVLDGVSIRPYDTSKLADVPAVSENLSIDLAEDAELWLDFPGTQRVFSVKSAGRAYTGIISASDENMPFVKGFGALEVLPRGTVLIVR